MNSAEGYATDIRGAPFSLTITRWDGWSLHFSTNAGRLETLTTDTGKVINWNYNGSNQTTSITLPATSQTLLATTYSGGNLTHVTVNGDTYQPLTNSLGQLQEVERPDGTKDTFAYANFSSANLSNFGNTSDPNGANASLEHTNRYGRKEKLTWDPKNHFLVNDGAWNYTVTKPSSWILAADGVTVTDSTYGVPNLKRTRAARTALAAKYEAAKAKREALSKARGFRRR